MLNINLVPEVKKEQAKLKRVNMSVTAVAFIVGGVLLAIILLLGSIAGYRKISINTVDKDTKQIEEELVAYKDLEESVTTLERGLVEIKKIVSGGRNWTAFFEDIEKATPADIQLTSFQITGNTITVGVVGKNIESIDRFIKSFSTYKGDSEQNIFANVVVDGYTKGDGGTVTFTSKFDVVGEIK